MLRIGLTGGIAAGKSAVAAELGRLGAVVVDADVLARTVVEPGTAGLQEVVGAFGADVLGPDGTLDRPALGRLVFADAGARARLNGIIHPRVRAEAARLIGAAPADAVVVEDIPLLVETHQAARFHLVLVVDAADELRIARMLERRGMDREDAERRIAAQVPRAERLAAADAILVNEGALGDLIAATAALWHARIIPFAQNLAAGRPAAGTAAAGGPSAPGAGDPAAPGADVAAWATAGTRGLAGRVAAKLAAALPPGAIVDAPDAASGGAPDPRADGDDAGRTRLRVLAGQDAVAASDAVVSAGFPRAGVVGHDADGQDADGHDPDGHDPVGHDADGQGTAVVHGAADPAVDVTVLVTGSRTGVGVGFGL